MRLLSDTKYAYSSDYRIGLLNYMIWIIFVIMNIFFMCLVQYFILCLFRDNEIDMASRGVLISV